MTTRPGPLVEPGPELTPGQLQRYARQIVLPGVGELGQRRLGNARVLVVGVGGLGSPAVLYLAAAGVGTLGVIDDDVVDLSNLQRQVLHRTGDAGLPKVESAARAVADLNPEVRVVPHQVRLSAGNVLDVVGGYDLVLDGTDNFATRYLVADACEILGVPTVWGAILRFDGQVSVFWPGVGPVYRDLFPSPPDPASVPTCAQAGVFGVLCAAVGAAMGAEAIKLITGIGEPLIGRLQLYDALTARWRELALRPDPTRTPVTAVEEVAVACALPDSGPRVTAGALAGLLAARDAGELDFDLVDVREPWELRMGRVPGARGVPLDEVLSDAAVFDPERAVILYCQSGGRSACAASHLREKGLPDVRDLDGGIAAWQAAGHPVDL